MNSLFENGGGKLLILVYTDLRGGNDIGKNRSVPNPFIYIRAEIHSHPSFYSRPCYLQE